MVIISIVVNIDTIVVVAMITISCISKIINTQKLKHDLNVCYFNDYR